MEKLMRFLVLLLVAATLFTGSVTAQTPSSDSAIAPPAAPSADDDEEEIVRPSGVGDPKRLMGNENVPPPVEGSGEERPVQRQVAKPAVAFNDATGLLNKNLSHESLMEEVLRRLSSPDERTRLEAGLVLRHIATQADVKNLSAVLRRGNNQDKQLFIIETLGALQDREAVNALRFEVGHGDLLTKRAALLALGNLGSNSPIPLLVKTIRKEQEDEELRKRAASALGMIGTTQAIYSLRTSLSYLDESPGAKNAAFWALQKARGEINEDIIDSSMPPGRRLNLLYKGTSYYFYHPANRREQALTRASLKPWLLICMHDKDLAAEDVFNICWRAGKKRQMAVLVPVADNIRYPDYSDFNIRGERFDKRLLELVEYVGERAGLNTKELYMFGYGTGGDFVQRFTMAYPRRIARSAYEATGFTMPDAESYYPKGLARTPLAPDIKIDMYDFLKAEQELILRRNSPAQRQGRAYFDAIQQYVDISGIRARVAIRTVDVKYEIWPEAERFLFQYD
jgi:hypothetical protein